MNQQPRAINDKGTRVPISVDTYFGDVPLTTASGFFYRGAKGTFLVTNSHVVAGRNPKTRKTLLTNAALPAGKVRYIGFSN
jgi:S1-C subfamily serine protease